MGLPKTSDHMQIKIKMLNSSQEPLAPSNPQNKDLKDRDILCIFKIKVDSQSLDHGWLKNSDYIQIKIKMPYPSQEHPASSKVTKEDSMDIDVLCPFKIKIESHK